MILLPLLAVLLTLPPILSVNAKLGLYEHDIAILTGVNTNNLLYVISC